MKTEKGVIIVLYKESRRNNRFAVLQRKKNWDGWELPKGHLEEGNYRKTVDIELEEETGLSKDDIIEIKDLDHTASWEYEDNGEKKKKEYKAFLVHAEKSATIDTSQNPCNEHSKGFFLKEEDAKGLLTYENNVEVLEKAVKEI